ncbi:hypothetical protein HAX54_028871 [Datura stramonium]|uniref:Pentatricopeptide repeat-containing protein n=1 Tax=Datura stramonium TaxID=4076 RepID=A0ABS8V7H3_DATST|nr:hypothetical protein [Datura stramonium]
MLGKRICFTTHYTFGNLLNACANLADLKLGRQAHAHILKHGFRFQNGPEPDVFVGNALIDMYMKCGSVEDGSCVFTKMLDRDWVSWNAVIVGYAQNGHAMEALETFKEIELGKYVAEKLLEIDPTNSGPYVLLSNMEVEQGRWQDVKMVRKLMKQRGIVKQPGCSWIEIQSHVHVFMVKDRRHVQKKEIYLILNALTKLMKLSGYVPNAGHLDADEEQGMSDFSSSEEFEEPLIAAVT